MFSKLVRGAAPLLLFAASAVFAQAPARDRPIVADDLRRHVQVLASDEFQGRAPATEGETRTINYIVEQFRARGLEPAGVNDSWFQPVGLVERTTRSTRVSWTANGRALEFAQDRIALQGRDPRINLANAPVVFAGHGIQIASRGIDQLAGANLNGAVVILLFDAPQLDGIPPFAQRVRAVTDAGAAAVIALTGADMQWNFVTRNYQRPTTKLAAQAVPPLVGAMPLEAAQALIAAAGGDLARILDAQPGSSFRAVALPLRASIDVETEVRPYTSNNVIGRIRGSGGGAESLLYLGHWDHFGLCRPEGEEDRICNGAVDNASGIASLIEIAGRLSRGPRPARDILFLATTAEEIGLLGAEYFATHPTVPLASIAAAVNLDTVAIHAPGTPVAVIGRGVATLDAVVDATIAAAGRQLDSDGEADSFVTRQDGWALTRAGVPAVMVGGSFSDMAALQRFLEGSYHAPDDELGPDTPLAGAAEDASLMVMLGRRLADPAVYRRPAPRPN
jgi:hypothetical protein